MTFNSLHSFYRSKEWESLRSQLRMERTNKNGDLLCAYCCKPIVKPYDCIAHHKNHLTESNVFDVNISLNPDNIEFVHHACHNRIHEKGYKTKKVYIVYGSPCSGKSTFVNSVCMPDDLILDIDRIYNCVNNSRSNLVYPNVMQIYRFILDMIKTRSGAWNNAYIVRGLPTNAERERLASQVDGELIFIDTDKDTCLERSYLKGKEYYKFVNDWWSKYSESEM